MTSPLSVRVSVTTLDGLCAATSGETCCYMVQSRMARSWRKLIFERSIITNGFFLYSYTILVFFWVWKIHVPPQHMEEESGLANCATKINKWGSTKNPWKLVPSDEPIYYSNKTSRSLQVAGNMKSLGEILWPEVVEAGKQNGFCNVRFLYAPYLEILKTETEHGFADFKDDFLDTYLTCQNSRVRFYQLK